MVLGMGLVFVFRLSVNVGGTGYGLSVRTKLRPFQAFTDAPPEAQASGYHFEAD
jgi:hypothetical protein